MSGIAGSETLLDTLFESAPIGMAYVDSDFRYVRINPILADLHHLPVEDHVGRSVAETVPELWPKIRGYYERALAGETVVNEDLSGVAGMSGAKVWLVSYYPSRAQGEIVGVWVLVNDVTERRRVEEALQSRNDLYAMLSRTNRAVSQCRDKDTLYRELCTIAVETGKFRFAWLGVPRGKAVEMTASAGEDGGYMRDLLRSDLGVSLDEQDPRSRGPTGQCAITGDSFVVNDFMKAQMTAPWRDAAQRAGFRASAAFPLKERGRVAGVLTVYAGTPHFFTPELVDTLSELTPSVSFALDGFLREAQRREDEAELRMRDRALAATSQGIVITDARAEGNPIVYASPSFLALTGYQADEVLGRNCRFLQGKDADPITVRKVREAIADGRAISVELLNHRKDGTPFWNALSISPVPGDDGRPSHFVGVQADVTARRELEAQLRQAQKMEAVGQLAAGIAHDFNNLLSVVVGYSGLATEQLEPGDPMRADLEQVFRAAERAGELTSQLLAFSRRQRLAPVVLDVDAVLTRMEKMLRRVLDENVELTLLLHGGRAHADPAQVEQIIMNLVLNARDAMPAGGQLTIETSDVTLDASDVHGHDARPGPYVMLAVTDTGTGMDAATRDRIFEPFFTTKAPGKGTGLGLATVFGIIKQSHGHVAVRSEPGQGTTFRIYLPRTELPPQAAPPAVNPPSTLRGTETILLVEDEEQVRTLVREVLRRNGYRVLEAQNGGEAFLICEQFQGEVHLLLTDMVMPRMSGRQVRERLLRLRPAMRTLFMSGYAPATMDGESDDARVPFLHKPIVPEALLRKVREVLDHEGLSGRAWPVP